MSNHLISTVYKRDLRTPMRKSVMALLADKASDDGAGIYASKQTMADELCCSRQAIIDTISAFVDEGLLVKLGERGCQNGHTVEYAIVLDALDAVPLVRCWAEKEKRRSTPLTGQPRRRVKQVDPSTSPTPPVNQVDPNPPEPPISSTEATPPPKKRASGSADPFPKPDGVEAAYWRDLLANRARKRLPNTASAHAKLIRDIERFTDAEWPPGRIVQHAAERGWAGIYDPREEQHGHRSHQHRSQSSDGPSPTLAAAAAVLAGMG